MKPLTTILAIAFAVLAMKPGFDMLYGALDLSASCTVECSANEESGCEGKACNPFQACNSCVLLCPSLLVDTLKLIHPPTDHGVGERPSFISEYDSEFWQPPKIV